MVETEVGRPVEALCTDEVDRRRNEWHNRRRREMLAKYPQIKELMVLNPFNAVALIALLVAHVGVAYYAAYYMPFWLAMLTLYCFNATAVSSAGVLCHEITHNMAFKNPLYNKILLLIASIPLTFRPLLFRLSHLIHHSYLEDLSVNPEYTGEHLFKSPWYKLTQQMWHKIFVSIPIFLPIDMLIYHIFYAKYEADAPSRVNDVTTSARLSDKLWLQAGNYGYILFLIIGTYLMGWKAVFFAILGESMSASPSHLIVGARYASEHRTIREGQPTNSMYGWQNYVLWNTGYHVEHHDFPTIPWNKIKQLHKIAPEYYLTLEESQNYTTLAFKWLRGDEDMSEENYLAYISKRLKFAKKE